jgi:hypothetical protein
VPSALTTRQLATVMPAGNSRFDMSGPGKCGVHRDVYTRIVFYRVVVVVCAREGDVLAQRPFLGTADGDSVKDG